MNKSKQLTITALLMALITLFTFVPLQIGPVNLAVLFLIPLIVGCQTQNFQIALILGLYTGILSLIASFTVSTSLLRFVFNNPLVSVLPRIIVSILTFLTYRGTLKLFKYTAKNKMKIVVSSTISSIVCVVTNTSLVLGLMFLLYNGTTSSGIVINNAFILSIVITNSIAELVVCTIITPPIVYALTNYSKFKKV